MKIKKAKKKFLKKFLKARGACAIHIYTSKEDPNWDYYSHVTAYVNNTYCSVIFMVQNGEANIKLRYGGTIEEKLSIKDFLILTNCK